MYVFENSDVLWIPDGLATPSTTVSSSACTNAPLRLPKPTRNSHSNLHNHIFLFNYLQNIYFSQQRGQLLMGNHG